MGLLQMLGFGRVSAAEAIVPSVRRGLGETFRVLPHFFLNAPAYPLGLEHAPYCVQMVKDGWTLYLTDDTRAEVHFAFHEALRSNQVLMCHGSTAMRELFVSPRPNVVPPTAVEYGRIRSLARTFG